MYTQEWMELSPESAASECHVLPCAIKYDGVVDKVKFEVKRSPELTSWLRGRNLQGYEVDLAKYGYRGYTVTEEREEPKFDEEEDLESSQDVPLIQAKRLVQTGKAFESIIVWEHGKPPSNNDPWGRRLAELLEFAKYTS